MGFFDKISKKASETYKNTAEKTNKFTRELKLKAQISEDKGKIEEIYIQIGKKVYEKHIREENIDIKSELIEECSKIDAYAKEIEDINNEVRSLKNLRLCIKCGAEIELKDKFCPKCGAEQEEVKSEESNSENKEIKEDEIKEDETKEDEINEDNKTEQADNEEVQEKQESENDEVNEEIKEDE